MKKGRRPIELEDHDRTLGKGIEIGSDRYDDDEIIDLDEIVEVDGGVLEDDEDFDLDVELIDLDADLDFDDLEPDMMPVTAKRRDEASLPDLTRGLGASSPAEASRQPIGQLTLPGLDLPPAPAVKPKSPAPEPKAREPHPVPASMDFAREVKPEKPMTDPFDAFLSADLKPKSPAPEVKAKGAEPEPKAKPAGPDYFDVLLAAEMRKALAEEEEPSAFELIEKVAAPAEAVFTPAAPVREIPPAPAPIPEPPVTPAPIPEPPAAAAPIPEPPVTPAPAPEPPVAAPVFVPEIPVAAPVAQEVPVPEVPAPSQGAVPDRQIEELVTQIESRLIAVVRELVEARLPGIVETVLREEIERLKEDLV